MFFFLFSTKMVVENKRNSITNHTRIAVQTKQVPLFNGVVPFVSTTTHINLVKRNIILTRILEFCENIWSIFRLNANRQYSWARTKRQHPKSENKFTLFIRITYLFYEFRYNALNQNGSLFLYFFSREKTLIFTNVKSQGDVTVHVQCYVRNRMLKAVISDMGIFTR